MSEWIEKVAKLLKNHWYIPLMIVGGFILMLRPESKTPEPIHSVSADQNFRQQMEEHIVEMLSHVDGAGDCKVTISLSSKGKNEYVREDGKVLVIRDQDGNESAVLAREGAPEIAGVTIASAGAGSASVRGEIIQAVSTLLGIGSNKICVVMMNGGNGA